MISQLYGLIQSVIIEPPGIFLLKGFESVSKIYAGRSPKFFECQREYLVLPCVNAAVVDPVGRKFRNIGDLVGRKQSVIDQLFGRDKQRVAGKCRVAVVRPSAIADRPKG